MTPILKYFECDHLPERLKTISKPFCDLAKWLEASVPDSAEKSVALRKLLEAKDAAVRAAIDDTPKPVSLDASSQINAALAGQSATTADANAAVAVGTIASTGYVQQVEAPAETSVTVGEVNYTDEEILKQNSAALKEEYAPSDFVPKVDSSNVVPMPTAGSGEVVEHLTSQPGYDGGEIPADLAAELEETAVSQ